MQPQEVGSSFGTPVTSCFLCWDHRFCDASSQPNNKWYDTDTNLNLAFLQIVLICDPCTVQFKHTNSTTLINLFLPLRAYLSSLTLFNLMLCAVHLTDFAFEQLQMLDVRSKQRHLHIFMTCTFSPLYPIKMDSTFQQGIVK